MKLLNIKNTPIIRHTLESIVDIYGRDVLYVVEDATEHRTIVQDCLKLVRDEIS